ncbi:putative methyltransferase [Trypanosoma brucei equiperdum]|uniref:Putative methyltransferase n=1 Tax=Trypanosoma brucei equiperdum TaxID=630700 RepID=A0A3L6L816_9TRYP|nr:putative methyltransferase [Trypanosoma brucei equiperdum]
MLQWVVKEVEGPFGNIATIHWAVPEGQDDGESSDNTAESQKLHHKVGQGGKVQPELQHLLEDAEDQLGAVLWNSNSVAMGHLQKHVLQNHDKACHVVELGAGVGCLGIGLAMAGARVVITDMKELVPLMEKNIELNKERILSRSNGKGSCVAMTWRWGPPPLVKQKHNAKRVKINNARQHSSNADVPSAQNERGRSPYLLPSPAFVEMQRLLDHVDLVVLCDALYGNPKSWPQLLYTLSEILAANPRCEVINFCEQRVDDVEGDFLNLLQQENAKLPPPANSAVGPEGNEAMEEALLRMRGSYKWSTSTEVVGEGPSDLGMPVRVTRISWVHRSGKWGTGASTASRDVVVDGADLGRKSGGRKRERTR